MARNSASQEVLGKGLQLWYIGWFTLRVDLLLTPEHMLFTEDQCLKTKVKPKQKEYLNRSFFPSLLWAGQCLFSEGALVGCVKHKILPSPCHACKSLGAVLNCWFDGHTQDLEILQCGSWCCPGFSFTEDVCGYLLCWCVKQTFPCQLSPYERRQGGISLKDSLGLSAMHRCHCRFHLQSLGLQVGIILGLLCCLPGVRLYLVPGEHFDQLLTHTRNILLPGLFGSLPGQFSSEPTSACLVWILFCLDINLYVEKQLFCFIRV